MTTLLVCGSRDLTIPLTDMVAYIRLMMDEHPDIDRIIHGGARGIDTLAGQAAGKLRLAVTAYPADWATLGRRAGPERNRRMLTEGKPVAVLAIRNEGDSPGTDNMVSQAQRAGVPTRVVHCGGRRDGHTSSI